MIGLNPNFDWTRYAGNALQDIGVGLTQAPTVWGGIGRGAQINQAQQPYRDQQQTLEEQRKRDALEKNQTSEWIKANFPQYSNLPAAQGWQAAMADLAAQRDASGPAMTSDIQNYEYGLANPGFTEWQTQRGGTAEISLTPTWGIDTDPNSPTYNKMVLGQLGKDNKFHRTEMNGVQPVDPATMQGNKTTTVVDAKTAATARAALPGAQQAIAIAKNAIDLVRNDTAGLDEQFGNTGPIPNRNLPIIPGVFQQARGNWQANFSQAQGQAFMQARNMLKGGGPITDYEGMKGEAAYARMEQAVATGDKANFLRALDDFEAAVMDGYAKLVETANGGYAAGAPSAANAGNFNTTSTGVQWSVGP